MPADFFVHNLGCKLNRVESDALSAALLAAGGSRTTRDEARVVVVNTCTVTGEADAKTRKAIRQALASPREPWVIATGCAIAIQRASYEALGSRVIAEPDRLRAQQTALELLGLGQSDGPSDDGDGASAGQGDGLKPLKKSPFPSFCAERSAVAESICAGSARMDTAIRLRRTQHDGTFSVVSDGFRTRRGIKIQDGCDNVCSYCVVRLARGASRSTPVAEIREQVQAAEQSEIREIILTGVNLGSFNDQGHGLCQLVDELLGITTHLRIRLSSLEPQHADDELLALMAASSGRLCAHLHLPLQSGCDRTLEAMARPYDTAFYAERVAHARALMPHLALTTDLIVGFPGESDEDFAQSLSFCERMDFAQMHVFRYSKRPQTPATELSHQVLAPVSAERARVVREYAARARHRDALGRVGTQEAVLVETRGRGTSESYHKVAVSPDAKIGSLIFVRFTGYRDNLLQTDE